MQIITIITNAERLIEALFHNFERPARLKQTTAELETITGGTNRLFYHWAHNRNVMESTSARCQLTADSSITVITTQNNMFFCLRREWGCDIRDCRKQILYSAVAGTLSDIESSETM